jgi:LysR family glycine cleavage system transcriptional activator
VRPFGDDLEYDVAHYIIHRPHAGDEPGIAAIKQWLLAEAGLAWSRIATSRNVTRDDCGYLQY